MYVGNTDCNTNINIIKCVIWVILQYAFNAVDIALRSFLFR